MLPAKHNKNKVKNSPHLITVKTHNETITQPQVLYSKYQTIGNIMLIRVCMFVKLNACSAFLML